MREFIITLMLLLGLGFGIPSVIATETKPTIDPGDIIFIPVQQQGDTKDYPKKPAYTPIYGEVSSDVLTIYSKVNGAADVTVSTAAGSIIMSQSVDDLTCGYTVIFQKTGK